MGNVSKTRMAQLRKRLSIPRNLYLASVKRQEDRAWAKWTDPTPYNEIRPKLLAIKKTLGIMSVTPSLHEPDPALLEPNEDIQRDEAIIDAFLTDNPNERRRPMARGKSHADLLHYWKSTKEGRRHVEQYEQRLAETNKRLLAKYKGDGISAK